MPRFAQDKSHFTHFVPGKQLHRIPFHFIKGPSLNDILMVSRLITTSIFFCSAQSLPSILNSERPSFSFGV